MLFSANMLPLAQAWLDNIMHMLNYFGGLKMAVGTNGYSVILIFLVIAFLLITIAVFHAVKRW